MAESLWLKCVWAESSEFVPAPDFYHRKSFVSDFQWLVGAKCVYTYELSPGQDIRSIILYCALLATTAHPQPLLEWRIDLNSWYDYVGATPDSP